ncbi:conjugative transfer signal peptidase TraF (plasmid) [Mesorhizobium sp. NBSH29]|uniref:conjugative transfer signal peptidase TraF n=1 Tax=Mesorhizobium sp. NBSH29 TaxID=2654249 RepID=UPI0018967D3A|nr:conjugative transfer signal peptidase TraF [Mesorhizobium sp. NBSH29]QPC89018.1 conjugative transfer signal peptidase TraF [Mesorhizobium sp. NBSH29]
MRHRLTIAVIAIAGAGIAALAGISWLGGLRLNLTPSYPLGLWSIGPMDGPAALGDLVFICPPDTPAFRLGRERGYLHRGLCPGWFSPLIKTITAIEGQHVEVGANVSIDRRPLAHSQLHAADAQGRTLAPFAGGIVPPAHLFLHSDFAGSYDSRYFGPIPSAGLLGRARPVLTFDP